MDIKLINIGFGNIVAANRIISIISPESAPIKRIIQEARDRGMLIDATYGRRTRAVIVTDSGHIILSAGAGPGEAVMAKTRHGGVGRLRFNWQPQYHNYVPTDNTRR